MSFNQLKKSLLVPALLLATIAASRAAHYYVDSAAPEASDGGPGNLAQPWKTLGVLNERELGAGDVVSFAKGSKYSGGFRVTASGSATEPITFDSYGTGPSPVFTNPTNQKPLNGNAIQIAGKYVTIDGLGFASCANSPKGTSDRDVLKIGAVYGAAGSDYLTVQNCQFDDCPIGIYLTGAHCLVTKNLLRGCSRFLCEPDWGPIAILVGNAESEISYNTCRNYAAIGGTFGADGGFIELDSRFSGALVQNLKIHHNLSVENEGFMEVTTPGVGDHVDVYDNVSDDYQEFIFWWTGNNSLIQHNTIIRSRINPSKVNTVFTMAQGLGRFTVQNNIFVVAHGVQVWVSSAYGQNNYGSVVRENNLYYCLDGSVTDPCGLPLGPGEKTANPSFVNFVEGDFHLTAGSPAIDGGRDVGCPVDFENKPRVGRPDLGAYEFQTTAPAP